MHFLNTNLKEKDFNKNLDEISDLSTGAFPAILFTTYSPKFLASAKNIRVSFSWHSLLNERISVYASKE